MPPQLMLVATTGCPGCNSLAGPSFGAALPGVVDALVLVVLLLLVVEEEVEGLLFTPFLLCLLLLLDALPLGDSRLFLPSPVLPLLPLLLSLMLPLSPSSSRGKHTRPGCRTDDAAAVLKPPCPNWPKVDMPQV